MKCSEQCWAQCVPTECELQVSEDNLKWGLQGCTGCDQAEKTDVVGRIKADKCMSKCGKYVRGTGPSGVEGF